MKNSGHTKLNKKIKYLFFIKKRRQVHDRIVISVSTEKKG